VTHIGEAIQAIREHHQETLEYMASVLDVEASYLTLIELGQTNPNPALLSLIVQNYGYDPQYILAVDLVAAGPATGAVTATQHRELLGLGID
jgi:transcriptional regulator with XRE-family HTH domain